MGLDLAVVKFQGEGSATDAFVAARERSGQDARWTREVGFVEHHHNGHLVLRGTFAGHYLDVDEALHVSQGGAGEGFAIGAVVGVLGGPPGLAVGTVLGAIVGSQVGKPTDADPEPQLLADQLRDLVPRSSSAIAVVAEAHDVDEMLAAMRDGGGEIIRRSLTADQVAALDASLGSTPEAADRPSAEGEEAREASEPGSS